jgi:hypothetical protein
VFNFRESLLFVWGSFVGVLAIITYVNAGHPGFGAFMLTVALIIGVVGAIAGDRIAQTQGRRIGRVIGMRITVVHFAVAYTLILLLALALRG